MTGSTTCSANAPSRFTPRPTVFAQRCQRPARQWRQWPQTTWPSPLTMSPARQVRHVAADLEDLADELVADDERRLDRPLGPRIPARDVEVRAADPRLADPDPDVVDAHRRLGDVGELEARAGAGLHEGFHRRQCAGFRGAPPMPIGPPGVADASAERGLARAIRSRQERIGNERACFGARSPSIGRLM